MLRFLSLLFILTLFSCAGNKRITSNEVPAVTKPKATDQTKKRPVPTTKPQTNSLEWQLEKSFDFNKHFAGLVVYDLKKKRKLFDHNGSKYFTPASNLKLFTFYTCLKIFNEQPLSLFEYLERPEGLYIKGTGHPGFLHPQLDSDIELIHFLRKFEKDIFFNPGNFLDAPLGSGWAWDDATAAYQCEKSGFPIHGNIMAVYKEAHSNKWIVNPNTFQKHLTLSTLENTRPKRDTENNNILIPTEVNPDKKYLSYLPIKTSDSLIMKIMSDTLYRKVRSGVVDTPYKRYSRSDQDQLFHEMLHHSDNMISEQLLLHASYMVFDTMSSAKIIKYSLEHFLEDLTEQPRWVDGSGLSRYNLASPFSIVQVLDKIYQRLPEEALSTYLTSIPLRNKDGLDIWLYAKSGTLSNNYNLSGYIKCKSGELRAFSFMNNHYRSSTRELKKKMNQLLLEVYERF